MNRYLVFAGDNYYPGGGWQDCQGSFPSLEACYDHINETRCDWWQIVDVMTGSVEEGRKQ